MNDWYICPRCHEENTDNWPVTDHNNIVQDGGCQACWEDVCMEGWIAERYTMMVIDSAIMEGVL